MDYWATPEATAKLLKYTGCSNLREMLQKLHVDFVVTVTPRYVGPPIPEDEDVFGCGYQNIGHGS